MYISFIHPSGKQYVLPVNQVVVHGHDGQPCAVAYEHGQLIVHTNAAQPDFLQQCSALKITAVKVPNG